MNIESTRDYCLTLPLVTEDFPFDERTLAFRVLGRIFACLDMERPEWITTKCDAERAIELRERHSEIEPAWHSYHEVVKKLKKQERTDHPEITEVM